MVCPYQNLFNLSEPIRTIWQQLFPLYSLKCFPHLSSEPTTHCPHFIASSGWSFLVSFATSLSSSPTLDFEGLRAPSLELFCLPGAPIPRWILSNFILLSVMRILWIPKFKSLAQICFLNSRLEYPITYSGFPLGSLKGIRNKIPLTFVISSSRLALDSAFLTLVSDPFQLLKLKLWRHT